VLLVFAIVRELRFEVRIPGFRVQHVTIATTLTDANLYTAEDIAELYAKRWHQELDIRALKQTLKVNSEDDSALRVRKRLLALAPSTGASRQADKKPIEGTGRSSPKFLSRSLIVWYGSTCMGRASNCSGLCGEFGG
jgi:hypothetical protein